MDLGWWRTYGTEVCSTFRGARFSCNQRLPSRYGVTHIDERRSQHYGNSGAAAINLAATFGAKRIIMLGFDCQHTGGKTHHHGDHPKHLGNARSIDKWFRGFSLLAADLKVKGVDVLNASRATALECFQRVELEDALGPE